MKNTADNLKQRVAPQKIINAHFQPSSRAYRVLTTHGRLVADKCLQLADRVSSHNPDRTFIEEAAMLHDIGIVQVDAPDLGCHGAHPYICHGVLGRKMLEDNGLPQHALVCERHVGAGLSAKEIEKERLPLPLRNMEPESIEEIIIAYADKFFSKSREHMEIEKTVDDVVRGMEKYGEKQVKTFLSWAELFGDA
ncbi:MAG: HD domain-containing protein [Thermodesulfobacteriota bacterium]|nr:HD domain-containing protein [Thermodesulfobacteriota bacterium]